MTSYFSSFKKKVRKN